MTRNRELLKDITIKNMECSKSKKEIKLKKTDYLDFEYYGIEDDLKFDCEA